nr:reverse transcriptase domain-containing protein [Tanacetum cinerariifolium]
MSTRSSARNLFSPLDNPELTIRRRSGIDPTLLNDFEMATDGNDDPPHLDKFLHVTQSIKVNGVTDDALCLYLFSYSLTHHASAWFDRLLRNSINTFEQMFKMFLGKYFPPSMVSKLKNEIINFRQRPDESLFEAWEHYKLLIDRCPNHNMLPVTQIDTFYNTINATASGTFMKRPPEECYDLIKNTTAHHNDWDTSVQRTRPNSDVYVAGAYNQGGNSHQPQGNRNLLSYRSDDYLGPPGFNQNQNQNNLNQNFQNQNRNQGNNHGIPQGNNQGRNQFFQGASHGQTPPPAYQASAYQSPCMSTRSSAINLFLLHDNPELTIRRRTRIDPNILNDFNMATNRNGDDGPPPNGGGDLPVPDLQMMEELCQPTLNGRGGPIMNTASSSSSGTLPSNTITNPKEDLQGITTRSENAYQGPTIPTTSSPLKVVERDTEVTKDTVPPTNNGSTKDIQPLVVQIETLIPNSEPVVAPVRELTLRIGKEAVTFNLNQTSRYSANYDAMSVNLIDLIDVACEEYSQEVLRFSMSGNPTPSTEPIVSNSSPTLASFGDSDFLLEETDAFLAIDDEQISLEIDDRYYDSEGDILLLEEFLNDDPSSPTLPPQELRVVEPTNEKSSIDEPPVVELKDLPPHLEYAFLEGDDKLPVIIEKDLKDEEKTALIKVLKVHKQALAWQLFDIKGELTLRIGKEAVTFNLDQTSRYSANYDAMSVNLIDLIDVACEEYSQEVLGFSVSGNPTPSTEPIVSNSSPTLTPFGDSDFLLEETDAFLAIDDEQISLEIDDRYYDSEGDILLLEELLNDDPSSPTLPPQELRVVEPTNEKSSIDEPPVVKLKDLPPHLEYAFLEGDDKLPIIIEKDLKDEEKTALIKVLKVHKQALAWQLFDIKGIDPKFYTYKILMEDDFNPAVQHQRRVNLKIHEGIVLGQKISKNGIEVDKAKVDVIAKLPHPTTVKECIEAFQTLKKKLTKAPILVALDWDLPFKLMCDASDFAIDHSALKYLFNKQDAKPRLLRWVLLLQEFDITVRDKKGAENLAANHLSRLENPRQSVLDKKEINETFPLETLNMVSFCGDSSTPLFSDFANYRARNFVVKGMSSQQKKNSLKSEALLLGRPLLVQNLCGSSHPAVCSRPGSR